MLLDIHHKYLGVTPITFEDIDFSKFPFFIRPHISTFHAPVGNPVNFKLMQQKWFRLIIIRHSTQVKV